MSGEWLTGEWRLSPVTTMHAKEISLIFLGFFVPVAMYFLVLAFLNRSRHPVMVSGPWDCTGVILALSGFLLLGGPAVLTGLYEEWRLAWLLGQTRFLRGVGENWHFWIGLWAAYFIAVALGAAWLIGRRRRFTSVYNVELSVLEDTLSQVLDKLSLEWSRARPGSILIRARDFAGTGETIATAPLQQVSREMAADLPGGLRGGDLREQESFSETLALPYSAAVRLEPFAALHHVTLHWLGQWSLVRSEVEGELGRALQRIYSRENPAGRWFMSLAISLFLVCLFALAGLVAIRFIRLLR